MNATYVVRYADRSWNNEAAAKDCYASLSRENGTVLAYIPNRRAANELLDVLESAGIDLLERTT